MAKLVFGCGYLGFRVAQAWLAAERPVYAVTRSTARAEQFHQRGLTPLVADVTEPATLENLPSVETVLYAVGYDRGSGKTIAQVYVEGLHNVLNALRPGLSRFIYVSSTGVYGQTSGEWVTEDSPTFPTREGGKACLEAERLLRRHPVGAKAVILRMGGLYGPGRIPRRAELEQGQPLAASEHGYLNLIHVDDAARIVLAAETLPDDTLTNSHAGSSHAEDSSRTFNVTDGHPALRGDYFRELARLANAPPPRFAPAENTPRAERSASDKRVSNQKLLNTFACRLEYPTYHEGLAAILAAE